MSVTMDEKDMETFRMLNEMVQNSGGDKPSVKSILNMIEESDLGEDVKDGLRSMVKGNLPQVFGSYGNGTLLAILFVFIIFSVILFFGYKLYKSIKDKELKKEEKKKAKQMKKKK